MAGSKKCRRLVSMPSCRGWPGRTAEREETRAVHRDLPPALERSEENLQELSVVSEALDSDAPLDLAPVP